MGTARTSRRASALGVSSSLVFALGVLSLAVPLHYLLPRGTTLLGIGLSTLHNSLVLITSIPVLLTRGVRHRLNPVLVGSVGLLLIGFTLSSRLPELTTVQSFRTCAALALGAYVFELRLDRRAMKLLRNCLPWMAVANLAIGAVVALTTDRSIYRVDWGAVRLQGVVVPAHLAYMALGGLLFSLWNSRRRPAWAWLAVANIAIIIWTGSRTSMLGSAVLCLGWLALERHSRGAASGRFWTPHRVAVAVAVPLALATYSPFMADRMSSFKKGAGESVGIGEVEVSTTGRLKAWSFFWGVAQENLWFGRGLGAGVIASRGHLHESFRVPHSEYLRLIVDGGFVGMILFVLAYAWQGVRMVLRTPSFEAGAMLGLTLVVLAGDAVLRNPLTAQHFMVPLWLFFALLVGGDGDSDALPPRGVEA